MRPTSPVWPMAITSAHRAAVLVESWRDGRRLAADVPLVDGDITYDDTAQLRRRLKLTVPASTPDGMSWVPGTDPDHPLAHYGQMIHVHAGIEQPNGARELLDHGWYLIADWTTDETSGTVDIDAVDLSRLILDARHYRTETPPPGATYPSEFRRLLDGILAADIDPALPATPVNAQTVWDRDRFKNLTDLCHAWGARWYVADNGLATVRPAYAPVEQDTPYAARLVSGASGTVAERSKAASRDRMYNAVVVTGAAPTAPDGSAGTPPMAVAEVTDPASPIRTAGPFGRVPRFYTSDLMTTPEQCQSAADTLLSAVVAVSRSEPVKAVPDPALELGDVVEVVTGGDPWRGRITALSLPLLASGTMTVTLINTPPLNDSGSRT